MTWTNIVIAAVAVYGAVISTITLINSILSKKPKIKVTVSQALVKHAGLGVVDSVVVSAANHGPKDITLRSMGFVLPSSKLIILSQQDHIKCPHVLSAANSCLMYLSKVDFLQQTRSNGFPDKLKFRGYAHDMLGKEYRSPILELDLGGKDAPFETRKKR